MKLKYFTAIIQSEKNGYYSLCPELDIASQGDSVEEAKKNLAEAVQLFFEVANPNEIQERMNTNVFVAPMEVIIG